MYPMLEFEGVTKEYHRLLGGSFRALDNFTLEVRAGEIFGFLGPNGAGKTTAIHLAMGFMRPTAGRGRLLGKPFGHSATRQRVGFLPENVALYPRRAQQLVHFYGAINGMTFSRLQKRTAEVLQLVGLEEDAGRNVSRFSRGMLQRVGLAQALVNDPELLILDEPTSALDPVSRVNVRELLMQLRAAGRTIFLSSHLLSEIELLCDRVAVLHRGKLVRLAKTTELLEANELVEITATGINVGSFEGATPKNGGVKLVVPREQQRATISRIWNAGGEIVSVIPQRRSLEEVFLQVTAENHSSAARGGQ